MKGKDTVDGCPSLNKPKQSRKRKAMCHNRTVDSPNVANCTNTTSARSTGEEETSDNDVIRSVGGVRCDIPLTAQTARLLCICSECRKPRVIYSRHKVSNRQSTMISNALEEFDYTCGAPILEDDHKLYNAFAVRVALTCSTHVEFAYYGASLGPKDLCGICGITKGDAKLELKKSYKTVLPICNVCEEQGNRPITARPYGKSQQV